MSWQRVKLKELLTQDIQNGYSPVCQEAPSGKWILGLGALKGSRLDVTQAKPAPTNDRKVDDFRLYSGDFLISRSNTLDKVGRVALFTGQAENYSYPDLMMRFRVDVSRIYPEFLVIHLRSAESVRHIQRAASGTSGSMVKINKRVVENIPVPMPPISEQTAIADLFSAWDRVIEKTERLIAAKENRLRSLYDQYFRPNSSFNDNWDKVKIGKLVRSRKEKSVPTAEMPLYSLTIEDGITAKTERYNREFLVKDTEEKTYKIVYPGDIAFNPANLRWGAIARSEVDHKVLLSPIYEVLEVETNRIHADFLTHALTCPRQIGVYATKTEGTLIERMAVKLDAFMLIELLFPKTASEQARIAEILNTAKQEIDLLKKQAEAYRKQKRGLMQKLLTGKWRVKITEGSEL